MESYQQGKNRLLNKFKIISQDIISRFHQIKRLCNIHICTSRHKRTHSIIISSYNSQICIIKGRYQILTIFPKLVMETHLQSHIPNAHHQIKLNRNVWILRVLAHICAYICVNDLILHYHVPLSNSRESHSRLSWCHK